VSRRPTRGALGLGGIGGLLVAVGATAQAGWLFVLAAGVLGAVAASALLCPRPDRCRVRRVIPATTAVGENVLFGLEGVSEARRSAPLRIEDHHPALEPAALFCEALERGRTASGQHARRVLRRGVFSGGQVQLTSAWPFGAVQARRTLDVSSDVVVVPRAPTLRSFPLAHAGTDAETAIPTPSNGPGDQFAGVREYRAGDDVRRVHWRSTARRGHLVVREDARAPTTPVAIVLAGADRGEPPDSAFEALVTAAASIALHALARGCDLDLLRPGPEGNAIRLHTSDRADVLAWLAAAEPVDTPLAGLAQDAVAAAPGGSVVLCLPDAGRAASDLPHARRRAARAGSKPVVVVAATATWDAEGADVGGPLSPARGAASADRVLRRHESVRSCLEG
jgi:uncharacterized protein (DUF58 family)